MDQNMVDLPPGFRFHPSDEELITHYLCKKICDGSFVAVAVGDADLNKCEPWDLPAMAKMGENEWYFFCLRDKKYPTGLRTNRATEAGYWKATGKDKEIFRGKSLIGMKKTLVFYRGRAPKGQKSNWVMHEYRLEGKLSLHNLPQSAKTEWVISRVFEKSCGERKMNVHGVNGLSSFEDFMPQTQLPPLMDFSQSDSDFKNFTPSPNVSCFSNQTLFLKTQPGLINSYNNNNNNQLMGIPATQPIRQSNFNPMFNYELPGPVSVQDLAMARACFNYGREMASVSQDSDEISSGMSNLETGRRRFEDGSTSGAGPGDLECLWPY